MASCGSVVLFPFTLLDIHEFWWESVCKETFLACMFCFLISDHVMLLEGIVSSKCRLMHVQMYARLIKNTKRKFPYYMTIYNSSRPMKKTMMNPSYQQLTPVNNGKFGILLNHRQLNFPGMKHLLYFMGLVQLKVRTQTEQCLSSKSQYLGECYSDIFTTRCRPISVSGAR